jgi:FtsP/CotA-like multicopper oxidase with cupredoxin domain
MVCSDINTVNGRPWPYLKVEPRVYRFTTLNSCTR